MVSFASNTITEWPALARVMAAARPFGPAPITTASYLYDTDIPALFLRRNAAYRALRTNHPRPLRIHRIGAVTLYIVVRIAALCQMFFACDHCRRGSIQITSVCTCALTTPSSAGQRIQGLLPEAILLPVPSETQAEFVNGVIGAHQHLRLGNHPYRPRHRS